LGSVFGGRGLKLKKTFTEAWERDKAEKDNRSWRKYPLPQGDIRVLLVEDVVSVFSCRDIISHVSSSSWISDRVWTAFAEALRKFAFIKVSNGCARVTFVSHLLCCVNKSIQPVLADSSRLLVWVDAHYRFSQIAPLVKVDIFGFLHRLRLVIVRIERLWTCGRIWFHERLVCCPQ